MSTTLPMFPLNTVLFPGVVVPLRVFEDRYRALVHHLLRETNPTRRLFGSVGIREGYEVGDHGAQSLFRVGCRLQMTEATQNADASFDIVAVGRDRIRLDALDTSGAFPAGAVDDLPTPDSRVAPEIARRAREAFDVYREVLTTWRPDPHPADLPADPEYLSWTLAALAPLSLPDRQMLLECDDVDERLVLVTDLLEHEVAAMVALPSLPATEIARTRWSPN